MIYRSNGFLSYAYLWYYWREGFESLRLLNLPCSIRPLRVSTLQSFWQLGLFSIFFVSKKEFSMHKTPRFARGQKAVFTNPFGHKRTTWLFYQARPLCLSQRKLVNSWLIYGLYFWLLRHVSVTRRWFVVNVLMFVVLLSFTAI